MIHDDELPRFKEVLRQVMKVRNFEELRKDVLPYVREVRVGGGRKFVESMFSKKFWSIFLNKEENADMKKLWESLPFLNGKVSQKKKSAVEKAKKSVMSSPQASETEAGSENLKPEEDLLIELSTFNDELGRRLLFEDDKFEMNDDQVHDFINQFDNNEPHYSVDGFLFDTEAMSSSTTLNSAEDKQMYTEDKPQDNFVESFWSAWNQRLTNYSDNNNDDFL